MQRIVARRREARRRPSLYKQQPARANAPARGVVRPTFARGLRPAEIGFAPEMIATSAIMPHILFALRVERKNPCSTTDFLKQSGVRLVHRLLRGLVFAITQMAGTAAHDCISDRARIGGPHRDRGVGELFLSEMASRVSLQLVCVSSSRTRGLLVDDVLFFVYFRFNSRSRRWCASSLCLDLRFNLEKQSSDSKRRHPSVRCSSSIG